MGARRLHTTTSSIGTLLEEEFHGGLAAPRPTCRSYTRGKQHDQYLHLVESAEDRTMKTVPERSPGAALQASCSTCQR
jgi:hypothetical protein